LKDSELKALAAKLDECSACPLRGNCIAPVGWFGDPKSPIVFIGEGPGAVEDDHGCPLIGPSGQLLDKALWSVGMTRDKVLTTNVVKCRPKGNRTPTVEEAAYCGSVWLERELAIIEPVAIVALGSVALKYLGNSDMRITRDRGKWFKTSQGYDFIATFHPSYILRQYGKIQAKVKWDVYYDLVAARTKVLEKLPGYEFSSGRPVDLFSIFPKRPGAGGQSGA